MHIRIEGIDLPGRSCGPSNDVPGGYRDIHVGIQRRGKRDEMLGLTPGDAPAATWTFECQLSGEADPNGIASDIKSPYIQGPPGGRFIYLNWVTIDNAGTARLFRTGQTVARRRAASGPPRGRQDRPARRPAWPDRPEGQSDLLRWPTTDNRMVS